jgi:hypothetical protein
VKQKLHDCDHLLQTEKKKSDEMLAKNVIAQKKLNLYLREVSSLRESSKVDNNQDTILSHFQECNQSLTKSLKHNYAFLDVYKQLHNHINENRFSDHLSAELHLE